MVNRNEQSVLDKSKPFLVRNVVSKMNEDDSTRSDSVDLVDWAVKKLDPETDWVLERNGQWLLRLDACERLARDFGFSVEDVTEGPMERLATAADGGPATIACVFVTMVAPDGRRAIRGGKFSSTEVDSEEYKADPTARSEHRLSSMAHGRAFRMCVRQLVGGFGAIEPKRPPAQETAAPAPHTHFWPTVVRQTLTGRDLIIEHDFCVCGANYEATMNATAPPEPAVETLLVETERSKFDKGGGLQAGDYDRTRGVYIRRGFDPKKHVLRKNNSIGLQASVAEYLVKNGCGLIVLEESGGEQPPVWRVVDFWAFLTNCKFETLNPADGPQLFAPAKLFEETAERPEWLVRGTCYVKIGSYQSPT